MNIESTKFVKIMKAVEKLAETLGYEKPLYCNGWSETEDGNLKFVLSEQDDDEELVFIIPPPKED